MGKFNLNQWLRKTPQPAAVLADDRRVEVPKHGRSWKELTTTIEAMSPDKLVCLDGQGDVIRSVVLDNDGSSSSTSPEISDVQAFAKLIAEAYEKGTKQAQPIIDSAMQFTERLSARLARAEAEIERLRLQNSKLTGQLIEASTAGGEDESSALDILAGAIAAHQQQQSGNGKPQQGPTKQ